MGIYFDNINNNGALILLNKYKVKLANVQKLAEYLKNKKK